MTSSINFGWRPPKLPQWRDQIARVTMTNTEGPSPKELKDKKLRLCRAYIAGGISDSDYEAKLAEIDPDGKR